MREKTKAIVLERRPHNEKSEIVTLFTKKFGRIAMLNTINASKGGKLRQSRLLPLSVIETEINFNPNREFHRLGSFTLVIAWTDIYFHPMKRLISIFLSEFLSRFLLATMPEENLWEFIFSSLKKFDETDIGINDFHLSFLISLLPLAGIQPDNSEYAEGYYFDMREGHFTYFEPLHNDFLKGEDAKTASRLSEFTFENLYKLKLSGSQRMKFLQLLLKYYSIHYPGIQTLKTPDALHNILT